MLKMLLEWLFTILETSYFLAVYIQSIFTYQRGHIMNIMTFSVLKYYNRFSGASTKPENVKKNNPVLFFHKMYLQTCEKTAALISLSFWRKRFLL